MDRKISLSELRNAFMENYEKYRNLDVTDSAAPDPRITGEAPEAFGMALTLTDGTVIKAGDSDRMVPMTSIAKVPLDLALLTQMSADDFVGRSGMCRCKGDGKCAAKAAKPHLPVSAKGIRAMSMLAPTGDPEGKWDVLSDYLIGMLGSDPVLNDKFYEKLMADNKAAGTENLIADASYYLYDDAPVAIDLYTKLSAMTASAEQLSVLTATIAADGYNPVTKSNVYDGSLSQRIVALMAAKGPHKMAKPWLVLTGLPAVSSYAGTIAGVLPGVFGIAAYSPLVNGVGVSVKAARAIAGLMDKLQLSALSSSRVIVEK